MKPNHKMLKVPGEVAEMGECGQKVQTPSFQKTRSGRELMIPQCVFESG